MQRRDHCTMQCQIASRHNPRRWAATKTNSYPLSHSANRSGSVTADGALEFGRVRVLLRQRQLLADGVRLELGSRAFDLLVVLLEADGSLVTKEELLGRVWPGVVVSEGNLKVQIYALRRALGADRSAIRTEFGRGYRFTGVLCSTTATLTHGQSCRLPEFYFPSLRGPISHSSKECMVSLGATSAIRKD